MSVEQLLPQSFGRSQLEEEKIQGQDEEPETAAWSPSSSRATSESSSEHDTIINDLTLNLDSLPAACLSEGPLTPLGVIDQPCETPTTPHSSWENWPTQRDTYPPSPLVEPTSQTLGGDLST